MIKKQLSSLIDGEEGKIVKIRGQAALHRTLLANGLCIGCRISVGVFDMVQMENCVKVKVNGTFYSLKKDIAANIQVEVV